LYAGLELNLYANNFHRKYSTFGVIGVSTVARCVSLRKSPAREVQLDPAKYFGAIDFENS